ATLSAKTGYWKGEDANIRTIVYKIQETSVSVTQLEAGQLDLLMRAPFADSMALAKVPGLRQKSVADVGIFSMNFNHDNVNRSLRQAIAYAINRPDLVATALDGQATVSETIPPGLQ